MTWYLDTAAAMAALGAAGLGWAGLVERNWYALRRFTVPVLPRGARPLRVLQISDLHLMPAQQQDPNATLEPDATLQPDSTSAP